MISELRTGFHFRLLIAVHCFVCLFIFSYDSVTTSSRAWLWSWSSSAFNKRPMSLLQTFLLWFCSLPCMGRYISKMDRTIYYKCAKSWIVDTVLQIYCARRSCRWPLSRWICSMPVMFPHFSSGLQELLCASLFIANWAHTTRNVKQTHFFLTLSVRWNSLTTNVLLTTERVLRRRCWDGPNVV